MVSTISPLVKVAPSRWLTGIILFSAGSVVAGLAMGALIGSLGSLVAPIMPEGLGLVLLGAVALIVALIDGGAVRLTVPTPVRSVPQSWWRELGPAGGSLAYGLVLGLGVTTFIPFASFYLILLGAFLVGPVGGAAIGAVYGVGRALPVAIASLAIQCGAASSAVGDWGLRRGRGIARRVCAAYASGIVVVTLISDRV